MNRVIFIGTRRYGLTGRGKLTPRFLELFTKAMKQYGVEVFAYPTPAEFFNNLSLHRTHRPVFVLVYNETYSKFYDPRRIESAIRTHWPDAAIFNSTKTGKILRDKRRLNTFLSKKGIDVPPMVKSEMSTAKIFSNEAIGSHKPVVVYDVGEPLDDDRYNTTFINTVREYGGKEYYVCLRALAVSDKLVSVYLRARPTEDGDPSVHSRDTPVDAPLINHLYREVATPNIPRIEDLCHRLGRALGPGFYVHDILPCAETGRILVCESGFKFNDGTLRKHLFSIGQELPFSDLFTDEEVQRVADAFLAVARRRGSVPATTLVSHGYTAVRSLETPEA